MAYNGSGTFVRLYNWVTDKNNTVKITASRMDAEFDGIATGLSTAVTKDGQTTPTANLPMGGFKLTGLGDATADTDALNRQTGDARYLAISTATADLKALLDEAVHTITDVASATTCDIGGAATDRVRITGTTTITGLGTEIDRLRFVHFADALTLTHNATSLILPGGANITTAAGDGAVFSSDASGNWRCLLYQRAAAGVDYAPATSGSSVLKGDGAGGTTAAAATDIGAGRHTIWISAGSMTPRTTNGAAVGTTELASNYVMLSTLDFDTTTGEAAQFVIRMPKSWNEGTITFAPVWTAASGSGGVVWALSGVAVSNDDAFDVDPRSNTQTSTDTFLAANDCHIGPESAAITIDGSPAEGDVVVFEINRIVGDASDTLAVDAKLIGIHVYITTDALTDA